MGGSGNVSLYTWNDLILVSIMVCGEPLRNIERRAINSSSAPAGEFSVCPGLETSGLGAGNAKGAGTWSRCVLGWSEVDAEPPFLLVERIWKPSITAISWCSLGMKWSKLGKYLHCFSQTCSLRSHSFVGRIKIPRTLDPKIKTLISVGIGLDPVGLKRWVH